MKNIVKKGFSLIELLVVVAIIGILAGIAIVGYNSYVDSADENVVKANASQLARKISAEKAKKVDFSDTSSISAMINSAETFGTASGIKNIVKTTASATGCSMTSSDTGKIEIYNRSGDGVTVCFWDKSLSTAAVTNLKAY
jgi:prepilin-type N-terminal cleavage/methylation domain-containing protein